MDIPSIQPAGPGGRGLEALNAINAFANNMHNRRYNKVKADLAPTTLGAEAASKLAYANLMGPQFVAKLLHDPGFLGNTPNDKLQAIREMVTRAGTGQNSGNALQNLPQHTGVGQPSTNNYSGNVVNFLKHIFGRGQQQPPANAIAQPNPAQQMPQSPMNQSAPSQQAEQLPPLENSEQPHPTGPAPTMQQLSAEAIAHRPFGGVKLEGQQWYDKDGNPVYETEIEKPGQQTIDIETKANNRPKSYAENTAKYLGTLAQGTEEGKNRGETIKNLGDVQLGLSNSGNALNRMADIIKNPTFQNMRNKIPFFQDKQLGWLKKKGTPEEKKLIGDFIATGENIIATGVQAFGNKPLVREFDLLKRQKISDNDPVEVAEGKLRSAIAIHDIMQKKSQLVNDLVQTGINESEAVRIADKKIDVSAIERATDELLRDKPTNEDIDYMAKKRGISPDEVKKLLKQKGIM